MKKINFVSLELDEMREVAMMLIHTYPAMFMESDKEGGLEGYASCGTKLSLKDLAQKMVVRVNNVKLTRVENTKLPYPSFEIGLPNL